MWGTCRQELAGSHTIRAGLAGRRSRVVLVGVHLHGNLRRKQQGPENQNSRHAKFACHLSHVATLTR
jgi:hypothetical protein